MNARARPTATWDRARALIERRYRDGDAPDLAGWTGPSSMAGRHVLRQVLNGLGFDLR